MQMNYENLRHKCGKNMKRIPIKLHDNTTIIEYYCEYCDESITFYPDTNEFKQEKPQFY